MREALGFEANPEANDPAPAPKDAKSGDRDRRSRTTNKDREDRQKRYEDLIGEFTEKQLEIFARSNFDPDREFGENCQSNDVTKNVIQRASMKRLEDGKAAPINERAAFQQAQ